jgi:hypothetical protein
MTEMNQGLAFLHNENRANCIIPVMIEECSIPLPILHITYLDMSDFSDSLYSIERLKYALLPGD